MIDDDFPSEAELLASPSHYALVVIRTFADGIAARIAQLSLEAHEIPSAVLGDDAGGIYPALAFTRGVRLAVRHVDAVRALRILDTPAPPPVDDAA